MGRLTLVVHLLAIIHISSQLDSDVTGPAAQCCPCPGDAEGRAAPGAAGPGAGPDCPCLARYADAEGAASLFLPQAVRAFGNAVKSNPKEDAKPLLHPEVDLASSVLETLREATDEEYRDALERDAARAAASDVALLHATDVIPEEARNVVTIIVSPPDMDGSDDTISEASHVHETRCIHSPLGNTRASFNYRSPVHQNGLEDILNMPLPGGLLHRQRDSNLAASDVHESVVKPDNNLNRLLSGLKLRADPGLIISSKINDGMTSNSGLSVDENVDKTDITKSPEKDDGVRQKNADVDCTNNFVSLNNDSDALSDFSKGDFKSSQPESDSDSSTSNIQEQLVKTIKGKENSKEDNITLPKLKSPLPTQNIEVSPQKPFPLKNLFKLRDVELIPLDIHKKIPKSNLFIPDLKFGTFRKNKAREQNLDPVKFPKLTNLFSKPSKITRENDKTENKIVNSDDNSGHIQTIHKRKEIMTNILDTVPSPSETTHVVMGKEECLSFNTDSDKSAIDADDVLDSTTNETAEPDANVESDSLPNGEDFTDITEFESVEDSEFKTSEGPNKKSCSSENVDVEDDTQTMDRNNDSELLIISSEEMDDVPQSSIDFSELSRSGERNDETLGEHHPLKTLEEIRKSVVEKLDALQVSNRNALDNIRQSMEEISETRHPNAEEIEVRDITSNEEISSEIDTISESSSPIATIADEPQEVSAEDLSFAELQNMSDTILKASEKQCEDVAVTNTKIQDDDKTLNILENTKDYKEIETNSDETNESVEVDEIEQAQSKDIEGEQGIIDNIYQEDIVENRNINLCPNDFLKISPVENVGSSFSGKSVNNGNTHIDNDLEPLASEPFVNSILRPKSKSFVEHLSDIESKLRQNIVQPTSLINTNSLNIFRTPTLSLPDISELNTNIPTLEEVRARVSEILSGLAREAGNEDDSSELDSDDFASNVNPMVASSSKPISILSPLQPLEDINLDIIQLKPIPLLGSSTNTLRSQFPGLNLNTYKAKLAIPKSLDLKPLKLASTLGDSGGLVGARFSIQPEKKVKNTKSKGKAKNSDVFSSSQGRIGATLADITSRMHNNALNLLNTPKSMKEQTLQASNALENIAENVKCNTENSINNIQNNARNMLKSPFTKSSSLEAAVDNLKSQTGNAFRQHSLSKSSLPDFNDSRQKAKILESPAVLTPGKSRLGKQPIPSIDGVVNNLLSQTESAMKNVQRTLSDSSTSIQKSAQNMFQSPMPNTRSEYLKNTLQPSLPLDTVVDNLKSQSQNTLRTIQKSFNTPVLSDISTTMQKHAQALLKSPIAAIGRDTFGNTLKSPASMKLRPHADKAVKDLQNTLKATLRNSPVNDLQLANPKNIVQMISNHQDDINDKLFAIHTDLNDRLESIHNDVMDPERLKSILSPPGNRHFELFAIPLPSSRMSIPSSKKLSSPVLKKKQPSFGSSRKELRKSFTPKVSRPTFAATARANAGKERDPSKLFKMSKAASTPVPTRINRPLLPVTPKKDILPKSLDRDALKKPSLSQHGILNGMKKTLLPKHKPLIENKIKVTFGPTTLRPIPASPVQVKPMGLPSAQPKATGPKRFKPKPLVRQPTPWSEWGEPTRVSKPTRKDPITSPSQSIPKLQTPLRHNLATPINKQISPAGTVSHLGPLSSRLKPQPLGKLKPQPNLKTSKPQGRVSDRDTKLLGRSEKPAASLLSQLTEALKNKQTKGNLRSAGPDLDAASAASDHVEKVVALEEPLKENVSYKCKMMCVKLD